MAIRHIRKRYIRNKAAIQSGVTQISIRKSLTLGKINLPPLTRICRGRNDVLFNEHFFFPNEK